MDFYLEVLMTIRSIKKGFSFTTQTFGFCGQSWQNDHIDISEKLKKYSKMIAMGLFLVNG